MKKITFFAAALLGLAALSFKTGDPLAIGSVLPKADIKMQDISGKWVTMREASKENGLLVMFSCNTCPYVEKNQSRTNAVSAYAINNKVGVIILNSNEAQRTEADSYESMQSYAKKQQYKWSYVVDKNSEVADAFGANRTPECFLFDKDMKLVYHGAIDDNPSDERNVGRGHLKIAVEELATGNVITVKESKSVGCTIKRKS